jgi:site-specific DNA recombinase
MKNSKQTLGIYCRISQLKEEGKDRSIEDQKLLGIAKAKELGLNYELYIDEGLSAAADDIAARPEFVRMLSRVADGTLTAVFAFDQSRFERNPQVRYTINNIFKKSGIRYYTHIDGLVDLFDPQAEFFGNIMSVINQFQVTMTRIKVKSVLKRRAAEGKAHGITPYGYTRDANGILIINEEEAEIVRLIFALSLQGTGTRSIAFFLDGKKTPTRYNKIGHGTISTKNRYTKHITTRQKTEVTWAGNTVRGILINPMYYGKRTFGKETYDVPSIVDEDYWKEVNDNFKNNSNTRGKKVTHPYLLKGLLRCGVCGRNMYGRTRVSKKDNYYMCSSKRIKHESCCNRSINIDRLDNFIWGILFGKDNFIERLEAELLFGGQGRQLVLDEKKHALKKLEALKIEKQKAISLCLKGIMTEEDLKGALKKLDAEIKNSDETLHELDKKEAALSQGQVKVAEIKDKFVDYTNITHFSQKIKVINELVSNIIVEFIDEHHYEIKIEYKFGLPSEMWKTANQHAKVFYKPLLAADGEIESMVFSIPKPISNPEDDTTLKDFFGYKGLISKF